MSRIAPWETIGDLIEDISAGTTEAYDRDLREFEVFAHPCNDNWEISYCEFTNSHDGPYLGGVSMKFHHNLIEETQDDGVYLSPMYPRHLFMGSGAEIHIFQNVFRGCLTALAFGGLGATCAGLIGLERHTDG